MGELWKSTSKLISCYVSESRKKKKKKKKIWPSQAHLGFEGCHLI